MGEAQPRNQTQWGTNRRNLTPVGGEPRSPNTLGAAQQFRQNHGSQNHSGGVVSTSISIQKLPNDCAINDFATKTRQDESAMIGSNLHARSVAAR